MKYIITINHNDINKIEVISRCNKKQLKNLFELYKKEYPNVELKIYQECGLK